MKSGIHPKWVEAQVVCACGNSFATRSIKPIMKVEVCSNCHPFFTGHQRIVDTAGRVERFMQRIAVRQEEEARRPVSKKARRREARFGGREMLATVAGEEGEEAAEEEREGGD